MTKREYIHQVHPPSKLILDKAKHVVTDESGRVHRLPLEVVRVEEKFRLRQSDSQKVVKAFNFVKNNSTGPFSRHARFHKGKDLKSRAAVTIQRFARGYIARKKFGYAGEGRAKLLEAKYNKLERMRQQPGYMTEQGYSSVASASHAATFREGKKHKVSMEDVQKAAEQVKSKKKFDEQANRVILLAKKNLWVSMRSLDFVVLKTHLREADVYKNTALYYAALNQNYEM